MTAYHVGIDLHKSVAQICVRDSKGEIHKERRWRLPDRQAGAELVAWLAGYSPGRFAVEALGCNRWFVLACREIGLEMLVVDPTKLDLKRQGKKTDKRDAREISRRLYLGDLDRYAVTYFATEEEFGKRKILRVKHQLVELRTGLLTHIQGMLSACLLRPPVAQLYSKRGIAWLRDQDLGEESQNLALQALVSMVESLQQQIAPLTARIEKLAEEDDLARWIVKNLPQAGAQTALTLRAELGDANRFKGAREVSSYGGVVPRVAVSADRAHHGSMTKRGSNELRWILGQWAVRLLAFHPEVKRWAKPMLARMHRNKVRMALARRLLVGVWVMFSRGEVFSLERCLGRAA